MTSELDRLCESHGITAESQYGGVELPEDWAPDAHPYKVTLRRKDGRHVRTLTVPFYMGAALTNEPTPADVLSCLLSDAEAASESFEDFCSSFGYDSDSRKAERTYRQCEKLAPRVKRFLGEAYETFRGAEH